MNLSEGQKKLWESYCRRTGTDVAKINPAIIAILIQLATMMVEFCMNRARRANRMWTVAESRQFAEQNPVKARILMRREAAALRIGRGSVTVDMDDVVETVINSASDMTDNEAEQYYEQEVNMFI